MHDGPLDMRMNFEGQLAAGTKSALELIESANYEDLRRIIMEYGEEPMAGPIARAIISARNEGIESTVQLARVIERRPTPQNGGPKPDATPPHGLFKHCAWR